MVTKTLFNWELPSEWKVVTIGDKFVFTSKPKRFRIGNYEAVPFVPMDVIPSDRLFFSNFVLKTSREITSGTYFEEGDLLVSKITPCFENGKQGIARNIPGGFGIATTEIVPIKAIAGESCLPYLAMYLLHRDVRNRLADRMEGATGRQRLPKSVLEGWSMPFPPLSEQRVIAGVLSKIQAAMEVQDKIVAALKELKAATMAKLFREGLRGEPLKKTEVGEIPESWEVVRLGQIVERITKGSSPNWQGFDYCDEGALFVRSQNVGLGELLLSETVYVPQEFNRKERRSILSPGDVLINIVGASIGRAAVADARLNGANINQAVAMVRLSPGRCNPVFLAHFLISRAGLGQMHRQKKEIARANLSLEDVGSFLIPIPARDEQDEIAMSLERIGGKARATEWRRDALKSVFSSMLHLLMTGRVRVTPKMIALQRAADRAAQRPKWSGKVDEKVLEQVVKRIVEAVAPEKIILFGSAARGEMGPDSDLDLLIVKSDVHRLATAQMIEHSLTGITIPTDIVVATPKDIKVHKDTIGLIYRPALREGKILYAP